jgi:1-phosphofructokinase family hexose kinase
MVVPRFAVGKTNRGSTEQIEPAGKGINVAQALRHLGCPVIAAGFLAGNNGRYISESLAARGILTDFVYLPGETRVNLKITDPVAGTETEINDSGFTVGTEHLKQLGQKVEELAGRCRVMVFSGSLPPGVPAETYADFICIAKSRGAKTVLDTSGVPLKRGVTAHPDLVKPNLWEVEESASWAASILAVVWFFSVRQYSNRSR